MTWSYVIMFQWKLQLKKNQKKGIKWFLLLSVCFVRNIFRSLFSGVCSKMLSATAACEIICDWIGGFAFVVRHTDQGKWKSHEKHKNSLKSIIPKANWGSERIFVFVCACVLPQKGRQLSRVCGAKPGQRVNVKCALHCVQMSFLWKTCFLSLMRVVLLEVRG